MSNHIIRSTAELNALLDTFSPEERAWIEYRINEQGGYQEGTIMNLQTGYGGPPINMSLEDLKKAFTGTVTGTTFTITDITERLPPEPSR